MVAHAESSKPSVNERLARAREQDLRRCRNLQAKLARAQDGAEHSTDVETPKLTQRLQASASSSSRAGLMFLSSTEQAQRERDQRSRERQLKRQVAGPIPPESWRNDFDRLSIRKGIASHFDRRRLQDLLATTAHLSDEESSKGRRYGLVEPDFEIRARARAYRASVCAGLRSRIDLPDEKLEGRPSLSLRDLALCVVADALNCPSMVKDGTSTARSRSMNPDMDRDQIREVLEYLPEHMRQRMMALCGRLAATDWPLGDWTAQTLADLGQHSVGGAEDREIEEIYEDEDDWEASVDSNFRTGGAIAVKEGHAITSLDLSFSHVSTRSISRMLSSMGNGHIGVSLRILSLAGWNDASITGRSHSASAGSTILDSASMLSILGRLPNLEVLSLAGSRLSSATSSGNEMYHQRAAVFLRKLSRSLTKLKTLDLSHCNWISADAILGVSWATPLTVAWPQLEHLLLVGCESLADPRAKRANAEEAEGRSFRVDAFAGTAAGNYTAPWHATHSQRAIQSTGYTGNETAADNATTGVLYDAYTDTHHRDPFELFSNPTTSPRNASRASFYDYVNNAIQPAIISHMTNPAHTNDASPVHRDGSHGVLMEYIRCPRSAGKVEMWQWQRARILEAVRGRSQPLARSRRWVEVWF